MELLIGFLLFDVIVYLLLRLFAKPGRKRSSTGEIERTLTTRYAPAFRHPSMGMHGRGLFLRPGNWPRTPFRHRPPEQRM